METTCEIVLHLGGKLPQSGCVLEQVAFWRDRDQGEPAMSGYRLAVIIATVAIAAGLSAPAQADAIDGAWCSETGRRFAIEGSSVTTSKGLKLTGNYTRHTFQFTLPPEETDGGLPVDMVLQGETQVRVKIGTTDPQTWRRCAPGIS